MISEKIFLKFILLPLLLLAGMESCKEHDKYNFEDWDTITVTASAYNSFKSQGEGNPLITAWGDTLQDTVRSIAVSRDLIKKGLTYKTPVKIKGFQGVFIVNDKMHPRWRNKIDIYMGEDRKKALKWGRRKVEISYPSTVVNGE